MIMPFTRQKARHLRLGRRGENVAARLLQELGLDILVRNYTTGRGELDIVAREGLLLCFVEVKTRHRVILSRPSDAVGFHKKQQIIRTAKEYLSELNNPRINYRFDIIEAVIRGPVIDELRYIRDAFHENDI